MPIRVIVDLQLCRGHGVCMSEAPLVFDVTPTGQLTVLQATPPESLRAEVEAALKYCPSGALSIAEEEG